jgi:PAS domain S-box-containing protein
MNAGPIAVLLVEDSPVDALLVGEALAADPLDRFVVAAVATLAEGLALLAARTFDVVLLDLGLPDSLGLATFEAVHAAAPDVPVVVFSGNLDAREAVAAVQRGAQDYVVKGQLPWELLARVIRYAIERQRSQVRLRELNRTLEARVLARTAEVQDLYDNAPCGYHSLDSHGRFVHVNKTELTWLGRTRAEVIGRKFTEFVDERGKLAFRDYFPVLMARGHVKDLEFDFLRPDGSHMPVILSATALYDAAGSFVMSRSTTFDMLERKQAAEALRLANIELARALRVKDEFVASMSHELRTPLNAILVAAEVLGDQVVGPLNARQQRHISTIDVSGRHLLSLINDILDLSKIEADRMTLDLDDVLVDDLCRSCLLFVREQAARKNIAVSYTADPPAVRMTADVRRMKQMLINLLTNAVKFTPNGGRVSLEVRTSLPMGQIEFAVKDSGIGIAPPDMAKLFKPFVQIGSGVARQQEGTGLGLALVSRLARLHGGGVRVQSDGVPGQGSCFTLTLPLHAGADIDLDAETNAEPAQPA